MSEQNKAIVRRLYEAFSTGKLDAISELVSPDAVDHEGGDHGIEGLKRTIATFRTAFPDLQFEVDEMVAEGDIVASRCRMRATHKGEFMGVPATGKQVKVAFMDFLRFAGGKAVEHWGITDVTAMMEQLGIAPPQG